MAKPFRTCCPWLLPAECRVKPSCQATSPSSRASSCSVLEVANQANSQPHRLASSCSYHSYSRRWVPIKYLKVPSSLPIAFRGIHACTVRIPPCNAGMPTASSSRCQCVSGSPGSLAKPRSIRTQSSSVPAKRAACCHREPLCLLTKSATVRSSSCTAKVNRTSFSPSSPKARRPCSESKSSNVAATVLTSSVARSCRDRNQPPLRNATTSSSVLFAAHASRFNRRQKKARRPINHSHC
mmetsp:Transcript_69917/g.114649  ORF Transcript_69917/g.114649 Transcript_69917/m.114649 type:complete len:239 (-) Transcript_69917:23-739(-)